MSERVIKQKREIFSLLYVVAQQTWSCICCFIIRLENKRRNGQFPLSGMPVGNHGSCIHHFGLGNCFDEQKLPCWLPDGASHRGNGHSAATDHMFSSFL